MLNLIMTRCDMQYVSTPVQLWIFWLGDYVSLSSMFRYFFLHIVVFFLADKIGQVL
jgi:hypothetical protein